jgi:hypothetical protein
MNFVGFASASGTGIRTVEISGGGMGVSQLSLFIDAGSETT